MEKKYVVLFSGGRTSAFLSKFVKENSKYKNAIFVFANTGKEREETLNFINRCDLEFNLGLIWLEAKVNFERGKGTSYKIVDFNSASRNGEPFENVIKKYPLPNNMASNCTRELKQRPIDSYLKEHFKNFEIIRIIGIRSDEAHRKSIQSKQQNIIYPLCDEIKVNSRFIREWWARQSFDLELKDYQGNCDLCFKKSLKKRLTIIKENPSVADWWMKMEEQYSDDKIPRFDLRTNTSIPDLIKLSKRKFRKAIDELELSNQQQELFNYEIDCFCKSN